MRGELEEARAGRAKAEGEKEKMEKKAEEEREKMKMEAAREAEAARQVKRILSGKTVTSFDIGYTFKKFLVYDPWDITREMSVMSSASVGLPPSLREGPLSQPEMIRRAYGTLFPDDEKGIGDGRSALDLALMTSFILLEMRARR